MISKIEAEVHGEHLQEEAETVQEEAQHHLI
jgi:hypothetical protein